MSREIPVYIKSNWGNEAIYIAVTSSELALTAKHIERLTGRKTLTRSDIDALTGLGFSFVQVLPPSPYHAFNKSLTPHLIRT